MILEHALLPVAAADREAFEAAFAQAAPIIARQPGYRGLRLARCLEQEAYLLLVEWEALEDHTVGFRGAPDYQLWRALLHGFYPAVPEVGHCVDIHHDGSLATSR